MGVSDTTVFADHAADLRPVNASAHPYIFYVSPGYFYAAGTALLAACDFPWHDDKASPLVAAVNGEFARRLSGSPKAALSGYYRMRDGTRIQIISARSYSLRSAYGDDCAGRAWRDGCHALRHRTFWYGGFLGKSQAEGARDRMALGAQRREVLEAALGRAIKLLAMGSFAGLELRLLATRVLALNVYQATPSDPLILGSAVLAMALLGLVATWIPAQRALSINPLILLREE